MGIGSAVRSHRTDERIEMSVRMDGAWTRLSARRARFGGRDDPRAGDGAAAENPDIRQRGMAKVPLVPIGSALDRGAGAERGAAQHREREATLAQRRAKIAAGWGEKYAARVREKGKLTARERLELLRDPDSRLYEVGTFVNWGRKFGELESPAAGVVTAFAQVEGRW
jgi:hypothetical protein